MLQNQLKLTILSPVHNEEKIIKSLVENAVAYLKKNNIKGEVLIIENGSRDKTWEILKKLRAKHSELIVLKTPGATGNKGLALKMGLTAAKGDYIVTIDADLWDEKFVTLSVENLSCHDLVVGSKVISGADDQRGFSSRLMNLGYNFFMRLFFDFKGTETHAKLSFRKDKIIKLAEECKTEDLVFDTELILRAEKAKLLKLEIPTSVAEIRPRRFSIKVQLWKTAKNFWILLLAIGPNPKWSYILVIAALLIGALLRFSHFTDWFFFSVDEEHYSFMTRMITVNHHLPLIGGPISGTKLYMAPWFLYFNAVFFLFSNNNPLVSGLLFTSIGLLTVLFVYLIGKKLFSPTAGSIAAILYGGSFLMALFDRHYWNITLVPFISALVFYGLLRWLDGSKRWLWITALVLGFGLSSTFSVFAVFLFTLVVVLFFKRPIIKRDLGIFLAIIALMHLPIILFDLRHNFWSLRALLEFFTTTSASTGSLFSRVETTLYMFAQTMGKALVITNPVDVSDEISICVERIMRFKPMVWSVILAMSSVVGYVLYSIRFGTKTTWLIGLLLVINFGSLFIFRADAAERHWLPFLPLFFITVGATLSLVMTRFKAMAKLLVGATVLLLIGLNYISFGHSYASYSFKDKVKVVKFIISQTDPGQFHFESIGECHQWGYRYLFAQFNHEPASSYLDDSFTWMYENAPQPELARTRVSILAPNKHVPLTDDLVKKSETLTTKSDRVVFSPPFSIFIDDVK